MSAAGDLVAKLAASGTPPELLAAVAEQLFAGQTAQDVLNARKAKDRQRKRSEEIHGTPRNSEDDAEIREQSFPKVSPPAPPLPNPSNTAPLNPPIQEEKRRAVSTCLHRAFPLPYQKFADAWNAMAAKHGLPKVEGCAGRRLKALKGRIGEHGEDAVLRAIANVPKSPHWLGENGWLGNFDSLLRPDNFQRMIEGVYGPKIEAEVKMPTPDELRQRAENFEKIGMADQAARCRERAALMESKAA